MKNYLVIALLLIVNLTFGQHSALFRIVENGKVGYINNTGQTVISPKYIEAEEFSEGLASFRTNGQYGFINSRDEIVIPASYDFAGSFQNGIADVYINNEVIFINQKGLPVLPTNFKSIRFIDSNYLVFTTINGKSGVYDLKKAAISFESKKYTIGDFSGELGIVKRKRKNRVEYGVIDKSGTFVVNFGIYSDIKKFIDGYALVELEDPKSIDGVINTQGELLFKRPHQNHSYLYKSFHNGFAIVNLYKHWLPVKKGVYSTSKKSYEGFIDLKGKVVFNDTLIKSVNNFSDHRAFIRDHNRNYNVIDTNFNILNKRPFEDVKGDGFLNGYAVVESDEGWGIIDANMKYVVKPEFDYIHDVGIIDSMFFFRIYELGSKLYGIKDLNGKTIIAPIIESFDTEGFKNGLLKTRINNKLSYINSKGAIVWQAQLSKKEKDNSLNITHLNRGYFRAYSKTINSEDDSGGWSVSKNEPKPLTSNDSQEKGLGIVAEEFKLYIKNYSKDTISFEAQDSRLNLKLQAKNIDGEWKDIEYLPSSWCGNSYHSIKLPTNSYWVFDLPKYEGAFETLIRAELEYIDPETKEEKFIYSNSFKGSVNPGQFWREPGYVPRGIMDPYSN